MGKINGLNDNLWLAMHVLVIIMNLILLVLFLLARHDNLTIHNEARREREFYVHNLTNIVDKMSKLIAQVEEGINGKQ